MEENFHNSPVALK